MKKIVMMFTALLAISLSACSQSKSNPKENNEMKKTLVAYFSASGTTKGGGTYVVNGEKRVIE